MEEFLPCFPWFSQISFYTTTHDINKIKISIFYINLYPKKVHKCSKSHMSVNVRDYLLNWSWNYTSLYISIICNLNTKVANTTAKTKTEEKKTVKEGVIDHDTHRKTYIKPLEWCGFQIFLFMMKKKNYKIRIK